MVHVFQVHQKDQVVQAYHLLLVLHRVHLDQVNPLHQVGLRVQDNHLCHHLQLVPRVQHLLQHLQMKIYNKE